jgi:ATP-dependent Lon protease
MSKNIKPKKVVLKSALNFSDTSQIIVPKELISQVVGQDESVKLLRKAAAQKRNVLLIGIPGTGKSLLAQAMSEILPIQKLVDVLIYPNNEDNNNPKVRVVKAGHGKKILDQARFESKKADDSMRMISFILPIGWMILASVLWQFGWYPDVVFAALLLIGAVLLVGLSIGSQMKGKESGSAPKLLINNLGKKVAPFFEATGARAGALLGDVRHDPLQSSIDEDSFVVCINGIWKKISYGKLWEKMSKKYPNLVEKHEKGYEAMVLPKKEIVYVLGMKDTVIVPSRIYSMNRRPYEGEVVEIHADGKKATFTPEHSIITKKKDKKAEDISEKDTLFKLE